MTSTAMTHPQKTARLAGILYLVLGVFGAFSMMYVPTKLIDPDLSTTLSNIATTEGLFRLGIVAALITQVIQIFVVIYLYKVLSPVHKGHARLMLGFILLGVPIAMLNELNSFAVLLLMNPSSALNVFPVEQTQALVPFFLELHTAGLMIAHTFWGLWLFPMGYLVVKSGYIPKLIGILLMIGCCGYLIDSLAYFLWPEAGIAVSQFTFIGELLLPLWLLIKGVNLKSWQKHHLATA